MALFMTPLAQSDNGVNNGADTLERQRNADETKGCVHNGAGDDDKCETENEGEGRENEFCIECGVSRLALCQHRENFCRGINDKVDTTDGADEICHTAREEKKPECAEEKEQVSDKTEREKHTLILAGKQVYHSRHADDEKDDTKTNAYDADSDLRKDNCE